MTDPPPEWGLAVMAVFVGPPLLSSLVFGDPLFGLVAALWLAGFITMLYGGPQEAHT